MSMMNMGEMYLLRKQTKRSLREGRRPARLAYKHIDTERMDVESHVGIPTKLRLRMYVNLFLASIVLIVLLLKLIG
jgi:hypothetical protein